MKTIRTEIKSSLVARYDKEISGFEYYLIPAFKTWWIEDTDVVIHKEFSTYVEFPELSVEEFTLKAVTTLRDKQSRALAEAQREVTRLEEKIQELQLLTYIPSEEVEIILNNDSDVKNVVDTWEGYPENVANYANDCAD